MTWTPDQIAKNKRKGLPHTWGIESTVEMLRAHGPSVTRRQYLLATCSASKHARDEVERRTFLRMTKTRVFIKMEDI